MTSHNVKGVHVFSCDACPDSIEPDEQRSFDAAWAAARSEGWIALKVKNTWEHYCPECKGGAR